MFMGHENVAFVIVEYDEKLLMFLLMEVNKFLMFGKVEVIFDLCSKVNSEGNSHYIINSKDIQGYCVKRTWWVSTISS